MHVEKIAKYIVGSDLVVDHLKLQKLLFYTQVLSLLKYDRPAFDEDIEAWQYGPVIPEIYAKYKQFRGTPIFNEDNSEDEPISEKELLWPIDTVIELYGDMTGAELVRKTHSEDPWLNAFTKGKGTIIDHQSIKDYYKNIIIIT